MKLKAEEYYHRFSRSIRQAAAERVLEDLVGEHNDRNPDKILTRAHPELWRGDKRAAAKTRLDLLINQVIASRKHAQRLRGAIDGILAEMAHWLR